MNQPPVVQQCTNAAGALGVTFGDDFARTTVAPRLSAALRVSVPLFDRVWLDGIAAATFAPLGHTDPFTASANADGTAPGGGVPVEQLAIPGESIGALTLGIGLRIGVP